MPPGRSPHAQPVLADYLNDQNQPASTPIYPVDGAAAPNGAQLVAQTARNSLHAGVHDCTRAATRHRGCSVGSWFKDVVGLDLWVR